MGDPGLGPEVRFKVLREHWSSYEILDGSATVWAKHVLLKVFEPSTLPPTDPGTLGLRSLIVNAQLVVTAFFDVTMRKKPDPTVYAAESLQTGGERLNFQPIDEPFSEYLLQGQKPTVLGVKTVVSRVRLFRDKPNSFGDPVVMVDAGFIASPPREAQPNELL